MREEELQLPKKGDWGARKRDAGVFDDEENRETRSGAVVRFEIVSCVVILIIAKIFVRSFELGYCLQLKIWDDSLTLYKHIIHNMIWLIYITYYLVIFKNSYRRRYSR